MVLGVYLTLAVLMARLGTVSCVLNSAHCQAPRSLIGSSSHITPSTARSVKRAKAAPNLHHLRSPLKHRKVPLPAVYCFSATVQMHLFLQASKRIERTTSPVTLTAGNVMRETLETCLCLTGTCGKIHILANRIPVQVLLWAVTKPVIHRLKNEVQSKAVRACGI